MIQPEFDIPRGPAYSKSPERCIYHLRRGVYSRGMDADSEEAVLSVVPLPTEDEKRVLQEEIDAARAAEAEEAARVAAYVSSSDFNRQFDAANKHVE